MASTSKLDEDGERTLAREIRNMVTTLTHSLTQLDSSTKRGSSHHAHDGNGNEHGFRVITLAGNNSGAVMRADLKDKLEGRGDLSDEKEMQEMPAAYANSNYQSVNNSIVINGSYSAEDPGIHIDISDFVERGHYKEDHEKLKKKKKKKKHSSDATEEESDAEGKEKEVLKGKTRDEED